MTLILQRHLDEDFKQCKGSKLCCNPWTQKYWNSITVSGGLTSLIQTKTLGDWLTRCLWGGVEKSNSESCLKYNHEFIELLELYVEEELRSKRKQKYMIYIVHTHTHIDMFTSDTRSSVSSHAWSSSAAVRSRRGEPLQWGGTLQGERSGQCI